MTFCCGSDMLLTIAATRYDSAMILNVPVLFCVICERVIVHPEVEFEYELLKDYAVGDQAAEVDLEPHISQALRKKLYNPANHAECLKREHVLKERLDQALDLYQLAHRAEDPVWKEELVQRLQILKDKSTKS